MGTEIIYPIGIVLGLTLLVLLIARSFSEKSRPFALPTLFASILFALVLNIDHKPGYYWGYLICRFSLGAIIFGLHAHTIKWLVARQGNRGAA